MAFSMNGITITGKVSGGSAAPPSGYLAIRGTARSLNPGQLYVQSKVDTIGSWVAGPPPSNTITANYTIPNDEQWHFSSYIYVVCAQSYAQGIIDSTVPLGSFSLWSNSTPQIDPGAIVPTGFGTGLVRLRYASNSLGIDWVVIS